MKANGKVEEAQAPLKVTIEMVLSKEELKLLRDNVFGMQVSIPAFLKEQHGISSEEYLSLRAMLTQLYRATSH